MINNNLLKVKSIDLETTPKDIEPHKRYSQSVIHYLRSHSIMYQAVLFFPLNIIDSCKLGESPAKNKPELSPIRSTWQSNANIFYKLLITVHAA